MPIRCWEPSGRGLFNGLTHTGRTLARSPQQVPGLVVSSQLIVIAKTYPKGYTMYIMLAGGEKGSQQRDIERARELAKQV